MGFKDLERGVRGSTTQHLSVLDYKIQQDNEKLARIEKQVEAQQQELASVSSQLAVENQTSKTFNQLDELDKRKLFGKVELTKKDYMGDSPCKGRYSFLPKNIRSDTTAV